jgi:transposase
MDDFADFYWLHVKNIRRPSRGRFAVIISATCAHEPSRCPKCGDRHSLRRHGRKTTIFRDLPETGGASRAIEIDRLRYRCVSCGLTSLQPLQDVDDKYRMTERCVTRICFDAAQRPFTAIASALGLHEKTVRRIVRDRLPAVIRRSYTH